MKRYFFIAATALLAACGGETKIDGYTIKGTIDSLNSGSVYLCKAVDGELQHLDTAEVSAKGEFSFTGKVESPEIHYISAGQWGEIPFFLENTQINMKASVDKLDEATVTGSALNDSYAKFKKDISVVRAQMDSLDQAYSMATTQNDTVLMKKIADDWDGLVQKQTDVMLKTVAANNNNVLAPFLVARQLMYDMDADKLDSVASKFDTSLASSRYVKDIKERVNTLKSVKAGQQAPDFTALAQMVTPEGKQLSLASFKGKYLLVDFWASWCGPCRKENPNVVKMYDKYKAKGFEILGVSLDESDEKWKKAIADDKLTWSHVSDLKGWGSAAAKMYGVAAIPHTVLIDPNGVIMQHGLRGEELEKKLAELLGGKDTKSGAKSK